MALTQAVNSKANVKKNSSNDLPVSPKQPVLNKFSAVSTFGQTIINLSFSVDTTIPEQFLLFVNGQLLTQGASNDYVFSSVNSDSTSSQVTLNSAMVANWNIQAYKLGLKPESEFGVDNRFVQLYSAMNQGFQGFVDSSTLMVPTASIGSPGAGLFYSSIQNRASMLDLTSDLKPRMGVERIMTSWISKLPFEFGSLGEQVYAPTNDVLGLIRFIGNWVPSVDTLGSYVSSTATASQESIEVTFYGTGLNLLAYSGSSARTINASVDGGSATNIYPSAPSNVLGSRTVGANQIFKAANGLTLGVHTVKIVNATALALSVYGFEILNESSLLKVNPGVSYSQGKKLSLGAQSSVSYTTGVTGTRGGRMLIYHAADGTIGRAFQATNAASALLTSTDHTNEEPVRVYQMREFGASRADDFSTILASTVNRTFTLDDNTTTLIGSNVDTQGDEMLRIPNVTTSWVEFTFIGTGVDLLFDGGTTGDYFVTLDNTNIGNVTFPGAGIIRKVAIASGLPYGTHVVRVTRQASAGGSTSLGTFIPYQPKTPTLPTGAVALGAYNVMANYVANTTAGQQTIGTGVQRKMAAREIVYSGSGWAVSQTPNGIGGNLIFSSTTADSLSYTFFGSGFDMRFTQNAVASTWAMTVDGASNLSGFTTSSYGGGITSFTASTGVLVNAASSIEGNGISISNLAIGLHTVTLTKTAGTGQLYMEAFDIISPIHAPKLNGPYDGQVTLAVGSQSISDDRQFTTIKAADKLPQRVSRAYGIASSPTTTSTAYVPCPDMAIIVNSPGAWYTLNLNAIGENSAGGTTLFTFFVDGVQVGIDQHTTSTANADIAIALQAFEYLSPGVHFIQVFWKTDTATSRTTGTNRMLTATPQGV